MNYFNVIHIVIQKFDTLLAAISSQTINLGQVMLESLNTTKTVSSNCSFGKRYPSVNQDHFCNQTKMDNRVLHVIKTLNQYDTSEQTVTLTTMKEITTKDYKVVKAIYIDQITARHLKSVPKIIKTCSNLMLIQIYPKTHQQRRKSLALLKNKAQYQKISISGENCKAQILQERLYFYCIFHIKISFTNF